MSKLHEQLSSNLPPGHFPDPKIAPLEHCPPLPPYPPQSRSTEQKTWYIYTVGDGAAAPLRTPYGKFENNQKNDELLGMKTHFSAVIQIKIIVFLSNHRGKDVF